MKLVADANVLLSAVLGGRARLVLTNPSVEEIFAAEATLGEVQEYAADLARRKRLSVDSVLLATAALPVTVVSRDDYAAAIPKAEARIGQRDPDDVDVLALALHLRLPVWSNDNDFEGTGVDWFTTAQLLKALGV